MDRQIKHLFFLGMGLVFLLARGRHGFAFVVFGIVAYKLLRRSFDPRWRWESAIQGRGRRHRISVPHDDDIRRRLNLVEQRIDRASRLTPHLRTEYGEVRESMWRELALATSRHEWRRILDDVLASLPANDYSERALATSLEKLKRASRRWQESVVEAGV